MAGFCWIRRISWTLGSWAEMSWQSFDQQNCKVIYCIVLPHFFRVMQEMMWLVVRTRLMQNRWSSQVANKKSRCQKSVYHCVSENTQTLPVGSKWVNGLKFRYGSLPDSCLGSGFRLGLVVAWQPRHKWMNSSVWAKMQVFHQRCHITAENMMI